MDKRNTLPSVETLREKFDYNPLTGKLIYKEVSENDHWNHPGDEVRGGSCRGYERVKIDYQSYRVHRVVWKWVYGEEPPEVIDHINGVRNDNRLSNLREATKGQNRHNRKHRGYFWSEPAKKYVSNIRVNGETKYLGSFDCPLMAHLAYRDASEEHYGEFAYKSKN